MLKSHEKFHSANGRRSVLIADDEPVNRELLGAVLGDDYETMFAADGEEALECMRRCSGTLSLVLLDLLMPRMGGLELLRIRRDDPELARIPVIVITSDQAAEVESLSLGAIDFIPKPYPQPDVILARVLRTIELIEDRQIIQSTERDPLTGLYNRDYFYRYAEQYDQFHRDQPMDALLLDVYHFHIINERYGRAYGDSVLRGIGQALRAAVGESGGIVCRSEADTFLVYCPHRDDYASIVEAVSIPLKSGRVLLRMGVYPEVDKTLDTERRFDHAKQAADTIRGSVTRSIALYDDALHQRELFAAQLIDDFPAAIEQRQFAVYYQPKFDVRPEIPVLASAEALVRWQHPTLGMISPGVFIPLFEANGLIQQLDMYVWRAAAEQIRSWKERFGLSVPVSVNVSRVDMYDLHLISTFQNILAENKLSTHEFLLEITESAYTQDSDQIITAVRRLREMGFQIEMDDFGTGYSSLNMISTLPIDALKLDMQFIRNAFSGGRDTRMIEVIIDIANYLGVPVIAEGVETEEQMLTLRAMGCDIVQGYYFSRPVPAQEYEHFVQERSERGAVRGTGSASTQITEDSARRDASMGRIATALSSGFESILYIDVENGHYVEFNASGRYEDLQIGRSGSDFFTDAQLIISKFVIAEDKARVAQALTRETLFARLADTQSFALTFQLMRGGAPVYYNLKAVRANASDSHHIVIGLSDMDTQLRQAESTERSGREVLNFATLAHALSGDMQNIYYIDTETGVYQGFVAEGDFSALTPKLSGKDFFTDCMDSVKAIVYADDQPIVAAALQKPALLDAIAQNGAFTLDFRLLLEGKPSYYRMKAIPSDAIAANHIIIGVTNVDAQVMNEKQLRAEKQSATTYSMIAQALAADYYSLYYVDTETGSYTEYAADSISAQLQAQRTGDDFFSALLARMQRLVYSEDEALVRTALTRDVIMTSLKKSGTFTFTCRLMIDGEPTYMHLKASRMGGAGDTHIVAGVSNVDAQIKRELAHALELQQARERANRDALTGVRSKLAFDEMMTYIDTHIAAGDMPPFAIAMCDLNDLKRVNDTYGHTAGDAYLKEGCAVICDIFSHSPVFRVGGDEFVAILKGRDFQKRELLLSELAETCAQNMGTDRPVIACGIAVREADDTCAKAVFDRADAAMYTIKDALKEEARRARNSGTGEQ